MKSDKLLNILSLPQLKFIVLSISVKVEGSINQTLS